MVEPCEVVVLKLEKQLGHNHLLILVQPYSRKQPSIRKAVVDVVEAMRLWQQVEDRLLKNGNKKNISLKKTC